jgi:Predicted membrane protein|nr:GtrA family protein [uncultured Steroidobacter sp.]
MSLRRYARFVVVGGTAGAIHFTTATAFASLAKWAPQWANVAGYVVALLTSYLGQSLWTFSRKQLSLLSFARFTATSLSSFALNVAMYGALLRWTQLDYRIALLLVIGTVAVVSFLGMNHWVFAMRRSSP